MTCKMCSFSVWIPRTYTRDEQEASGSSFINETVYNKHDVVEVDGVYSDTMTLWYVYYTLWHACNLQGKLSDWKAASDELL